MQTQAFGIHIELGHDRQNTAPQSQKASEPSGQGPQGNPEELGHTAVGLDIHQGRPVGGAGPAAGIRLAVVRTPAGVAVHTAADPEVRHTGLAEVRRTGRPEEVHRTVAAGRNLAGVGLRNQWARGWFSHPWSRRSGR